MDTDIQNLIETLHDSAGRIMLVTAGAGTQALAWILGVPGASRTLVEALVPYDWASFNDFMGRAPEQYVALETARQMAGRALTRGRWLRQEETVIGVACTATIVTERPKRGEHRAHVSTWQENQVVGYSLYLEKGARDRAEEEEMVSRLILNALAHTYQLADDLLLPLGEGDELEITTTDLAAYALRLYRRQIESFGICDDGLVDEGPAHPALLLSGSFNPLHDGHLGMAVAAEKQTGQRLSFEISMSNVDKTPLLPETILSRMAQFAGRWAVYASNAPTFVEKSQLYPGVTFVVGYDTALRILHPRYYENSREKMEKALAEIQQQGCSFLVAGRLGKDDVFRTTADLDIPAPFQSIFHPLNDFRRDISSTELRRSGSRGSR